MNAFLQISTGLFDRCTELSASEVGRRLESLLQRLPVSGVIYGWGEKKGLFETILETARRHRAETYLWLPVFADIRNPEHADPMVYPEAAEETPLNSCPGEEFRFVCPGSARNVTAVTEAYEILSEGRTPDGVFLDRIRWSSAVLSPVHFFGCRCERCLGRQRQAGISGRKLREILQRQDSLAACAPLRMEKGRYFFAAPELDRLAEIRRETISGAVRHLCGSFRAKGLRVGVDVFAPALADLVGQDLPALLEAADWIKPMMYFRTDAPAGIPYELAAYGKNMADALEKLWAAPVGDLSSMERQLRSLPNPAGRIFPGIEVNYIPGICEPDANAFSLALRAAKAAGCNTVILSWDVLQIREEELCVLETCLQDI